MRIIYYVSTFVFLCLLTLTVLAENTIDIEHADRLSQRVINGEQARILNGNVQLRQDDMRMRCDSAIHFIQRNELEAYGNIHIKQGDTVDLYGDRLYYDGNKRIATIKDNVRLEEEEMVLYTDKLYYEPDKGMAYYYTGGEIHESENVLTSREGYYFSGTKELEFKDSVRLVNPDFLLKSDTLRYNTRTSVAFVEGPATVESDDDFLYCEGGWYDTEANKVRVFNNAYVRHMQYYLYGDTLYLDRDSGYGTAKQNVRLTDTVDYIEFYGHYAEYLETPENAFITDSASVRQVSDGDTLWLAADTLMMHTDASGSHRILKAYRHVKTFNRSFQAFCDSAVYTTSDSILTMFQEPKLWADSQQMSADTIRANVWSGTLHQIHLIQNAFLVSPLKDTLFYNQIKGREMTGFFRQNELYRIDVSGNSEGIYFLLDDEGRYIGINRIQASDIRILVKNREIEEMTFIREPSASVYPVGKLEPQQLMLRGFSWVPGEIPLKPEDIFRAHLK